jgi:ATP-binding cassette, subfamily B, bacterial MsbA
MGHDRAPRDRADVRDLRRLLWFARPYLGRLILAVGFSLLYSSGIMGRAALLQPLMDNVVLPTAAENSLEQLGGAEDPQVRETNRAQLQRNVRENLEQILLGAFLLVVLMPLARLGRDYLTDWLVTRLHVDLQQQVGEKLLRLPLAVHQREGAGDFVARMSNDTLLATRAQIAVYSDAIQNTAMVIAALGAALLQCWQLTIVTLLAGPPIAIVMRSFGGRIRSSSRARQDQVSEVMQRVLQMLAGIKVIKAFHAEASERERFDAEVTRYFRRAMRVVRNRVYSRSLVEFSSQLAFLSMLLVGIYATINEIWGLTPGRLMAFVTITATLYRPAKSGSEVYNTLQDSLPGARRMFEILDAHEIPADAPDAVEMRELREGISYEHVSFSYGREPVLEDLTLRIRAGESVALVGRTGSGKTTVVDLLLRFFEPGGGRICLDGIELRQIRRASLYRMVAVVTQEPFLFDGTILENLRYGRPEASIKEVQEAAHAANAHEFIERLPSGYETEVGQAGALLSGGQRQRLTIARAILRDPQILIFDEATSSLDAHSEQLVQDAIRNLMRGRTVLVIAHRLATVLDADRIAVIEGGRVSMSGTHAELMEQPGLYRDLVQLQLAPSDAPAADAPLRS